MIHVVTIDNQHLYARQLDQMFRMRHEYYVEGHGWSGLTASNGHETDEFDNEQAVYLMSLTPEGEVAASIRLNPATGPTLLRKFLDYCESPPPSGADVWDASRWFAHPRHRRAENSCWPSNHQRELILGLLEFGVSRGASSVTMLIESRLAERIGAYGWPMRYLGAPRPYEDDKGIAVAAEIGLGKDVLSLVRNKTGVHHGVLVEAPPDPPRASPSDVRRLVETIGPSQAARLLSSLFDRLAEIDDSPFPQRMETLAALFRIAGLDESDATVRVPGPAAPLRSTALGAN